KVTAPAGVLSVLVNRHEADLNDSNVFRSVVDLSGEKTPIHIAAIDQHGKRTEPGPGLTDEEYEPHLEKMARITARVVLTAGALAPVLDSTSPDSQHSIFAAALIEILTQNDTVLSAQDLGRTIAAKVSLAATKVGYEQEPQYAPLNHSNHQG